MPATIAVIACLPSDLLTRVRQALGRGFHLVPVAEWTALRETWTRTPTAVLVVDPRESADTLPSLEWASGAPVLLYTAFTADAVRRAFHISTTPSGGSVAIALRGQDDSPGHLRRLLNQVTSCAIATRLADRLAARLSGVPEHIREALLSAVTSPLRAVSVELLAERTGVQPQVLRRWTIRAHVTSPKRLLSIGRVAWAYHHLRVRAASVRVIAAQVGYESPKDLSRSIRALLAIAPRDFRYLPESELLERLEARLARDS